MHNNRSPGLVWAVWDALPKAQGRMALFSIPEFRLRFVERLSAVIPVEARVRSLVLSPYLLHFASSKYPCTLDSTHIRSKKRQGEGGGNTARKSLRDCQTSPHRCSGCRRRGKPVRFAPRQRGTSKIEGGVSSSLKLVRIIFCPKP